MTPAARDAAAIEILDRWLGGQPVEAALTGWARASRFAGSKDREAVRDLVFAAVRRRTSAAACGGGGGRGLIIGVAIHEGRDLSSWTGEGHAPAPLDATEINRIAAGPDALQQTDRATRLDCPAWLLPHFDTALGAKADAVLTALRDRAAVHIRANTRQTTRADLRGLLHAEGIEAEDHPLAATALTVTHNARALKNSRAFAEGLFEMQDAASQAVALRFAAAVPEGARVLDYCAGGGGKSLALAAEGLKVTAHDIDPRRMRDLPDRAQRAGVSVSRAGASPGGNWPAILADAPCSGSGSWRRAPEAKWTLTPARLDELTRIQGDILTRCAALCAPGAVLGYATCSMLTPENEDRVADFLASHPGWRSEGMLRLDPLDGADGFFLALLRAPS
ncbi:MAG: RsmB/NOP family class I SAM-dependent RNA methyltransferase [Paracoccaceae bacterium]